MIHIGCHLSSAGGYEKMGQVALSIGADTFQFFTRNPRGGSVKALDLVDAANLGEILVEHSFAPLLAHAPYTLNPASDTPQIKEFAAMVFADDLARMEQIPCTYYNIHPGSHTGLGAERGIQLIAQQLNQVLRPETTTTILLETMSGKGSEVGKTFQELKQIMDQVALSDKIGVCMDTCHLFSAGYDIVHDLDGVLTEFDRIIGLDRVKTVHLNDSLTPFAANKDRHAGIGEGQIGLDALIAFVTHPALSHLPFLLETPYEPEGHAREIQLIKRLIGETE